MDVTEVKWGEEAYRALCNVNVRLNLRTTENEEQGQKLLRNIRDIRFALRALSRLYGHCSKMIPGEKDPGFHMEA